MMQNNQINNLGYYSWGGTYIPGQLENYTYSATYISEPTMDKTQKALKILNTLIEKKLLVKELNASQALGLLSEIAELL